MENSGSREGPSPGSDATADAEIAADEQGENQRERTKSPRRIGVQIQVA